jgi:DHA1 family bicyclomycin/chloramphenicol resistance-like MFS transporter
MTVAWGWQSVFVILTLLGALVLAACIFFLPESHQPDTSISLRPAPIIRNFLEVIKEPQFYTYALAGACAFSGLFAYVSTSPVLFIDIFKVSKENFGWIFAGLSVGFIGSNQVNSLLLKKYRSDQIIVWALFGQAIAGIVFFIGTYYGWFGITGTIIMLFLYLSCLGFANPNATALSIAPFRKNAGSAAALMGALQMGIGGLAATCASLLTADSAVPMVAIMGGVAILSFAILMFGRTHITHPVLLQGGGDAAVIH